MSNPLYDALFAPLAGDARPILTRDCGGQITAARLHQQLAQYAHALRALGLQPGDRMAVQASKSPDFLALYGAAVATGVIFLPLNTAYTAEELSYFVSDCSARLLVTDPAQASALGPLAAQLGAGLETLGPEGTLDQRAKAQPTALAPTPRRPDDLAALLYTSGTTGRSKGAMLSQRNLLSNAQTLVRHWGFTARDVLLHALPMFHTHGLFVACNVVLLARAQMIFLPRFDPDLVFAHLPQASTLMGVPTFYTRLLEDPRLTRDRVAGMRLFISGSAPLLAETHQRWSARTGHAILERYGMTETNMLTSNPLEGPRRPGTVGPALPGVDLRITDPDTGTVLDAGAPGMIEVRGPNVFQGYWNMPEKTAAEFRDGWFITGDLGMVDADGYVSIVGRAKDLIISGGYNVYPKEIEQVLDALPDVRESAVIGLPHPDLGEAVVAVLATEGAGPSEDALRRAVETRLARYKQPRHYLRVRELPRNTMGKVQKAALRQDHAGLFQP
ncbi:MAG: malonate--CoA ligase [Roseinatronobacter sp.]